MVNQNTMLKADLWGDGMLSKEDRYSKIKIQHIPVMITDNGKILCLPNNLETSHIGVTAMCYDKETEVLTSEGFKKFSKLNRKELIAQVNPKTFEMNFVKPLSYTKERYSGIMIGFKGKTYDLFVTPNHNMFCGRYEEVKDEKTNKIIPIVNFSFTDALSVYQKISQSYAGLTHIWSILNIEKNGNKINKYITTITDNNRYLLPYNDYVYCVEVPTHLLVIRRNGKISLCGNTGKGKGILGNTLLGFEYFMLHKLCLVLNDFQQETYENSLPCLNRVFMNNLKIIGIAPRGYPIVYVYPSNKDLKIGETEKLFPHLKMSIPTRVVISHIEDYYKLDKSARYVTGYIDRFLECRDLEEIEEVIDEILTENFPDKKGSKFEEMKFKIKVTFKNIFDEKITDSASPDAPAFLTIKRRGNIYSNFTIQALLASGLIPSIQTSEIRTKSWFSSYMAWIVESIYKDKYEDKYLKNKSLSMFVPEIDKMWKGDKGELIKNALKLIGTNGRRAGIGLRWDAQDYDAVPDAIRSNTKHLFVLRKSNAEEVRGIVKDFSIDKEVQGWILKLNTEPEKGIFECVALTTDKFYLYSLRDGSITTTREPQRGRLITPMAEHKIPGRKIDEVIA